MYPKPIQKLIDIFTKFPGIGPRQAGRFALFILKENGSLTADLVSALKEVKEKVVFCGQCFRSMDPVRSQTPKASADALAHRTSNGVEGQENSFCSFCRDSKRDQAAIAVVEKEADLQNLEKTGLHQGVYHVLGGVISPLDADSPKNLRLREMHGRVKGILESQNKCEIILATGSTTEGDTTALYIERVLEPLKKQYANFKISRLGRGLSLGSELEYADEITLKNALTNRK